MKRIAILLSLFVMFLIRLPGRSRASRSRIAPPGPGRPNSSNSLPSTTSCSTSSSRTGAAITFANLSASDFEIYENGKRVDVESLDEYSMLEPSRLNLDTLEPEPVQLEQPSSNNSLPSSTVFTSSSNGLARAIDMAEKFILDRVQTGDRVMVVSYQGSLRMVQPFTQRQIPGD